MTDGSGPGLTMGFDAGSVALKVVVTDSAGILLEQSYTRMQGRPIETALAVFGELLGRHRSAVFDLVAGTGSSGRLICGLLGVPFVNEVISHATAVRHLYPDVRTVIEMGGQDSKLIFLPELGSNGRPIADFATNTNCAAGTGSFLDQQASRLGVRIEHEFGFLAAQSRCVPRVAGRCSVFAKSDMIHLQQQAAAVPDILAGLCFGLVRNLKSNLGRGMDLPRPIAFCGGVAANQGVVQALRGVFELGAGELIIPDCHASTGALGAVLATGKDRVRLGAGHGRPRNGRLDLGPLRQRLGEASPVGHRLAPLPAQDDRRAEPPLPGPAELEARSARGPIEAYLGLDVGSISTKVAVIDRQQGVLAKTYQMTAGRPLEAVRRVLREIRSQVGDHVRICGAATTGSGRYLTGDFIGADLVVNEITAQAAAAALLDPSVDTIFEIGGQDSKFIRLEGGVVVDFDMNHACAAGTGSFLEEQAERLGVDIKGEFADLAMSSPGPIRLGERCTVFIESDLLSHQQQGARTEDLAAGLCYSIVSNYLNRVVGARPIGRRIFFQGGTAYNRGVVAAFEKVTGQPITVPPHHEVTGAIGAAVLAQRNQARRHSSKFGGFELAELEADVRAFECRHCSNSCEINEVVIQGRDPLYYGSRCDRYNLKRGRPAAERLPDLFAERHRLLMEHAHLGSSQRPEQPTVGIPLSLSAYQLLPFWGTFLGELGFHVITSPASTPSIIRLGVEAVLSTPCFPVKVAYGHALELAGRAPDALWIPSLINMSRDHPACRDNQPCPYVTAAPYQVSAVLEARGCRVKIFQPPVRFQEGRRGLLECLRPLSADLKTTPAGLRRAIDRAWRAQEAFEEACRARGREVLEGLDPNRRTVVIVGRPYNTCDRGVSLDLAKKLRTMGVLPIPMDFLDLRVRGPAGDRILDSMYWKHGRQILRAAELVRDDARLHAVYLSNFGCGPDSFVIGYFKRLLAPRPCLVLEIDEHSADTGLVTRLEAFLDSLAAAPARAVPPARPLYPSVSRNGHIRKIYMPWMGDYSHAVAAAFRAHGHPTEVMPMADQESLEAGRRCSSGKECLPFLITAGDMVQAAQRPSFDPKRSAFFMPCSTGPCRFGQYNCAHKLILRDLGLDEVPILSPSQDQGFYQQWDASVKSTVRLVWKGLCALDVLMKACLALRPYETERGGTDQVYRHWMGRLCELIERRPSVNQLAAMMSAAAGGFAAIGVDRRRRKPRIGVVGEIYIRLHDFSNGSLLRQLEELGAETTLSSFLEWGFYTNWIRKERARREGDVREWLINAVQDQVQRRVQRRIVTPFEPLLGPLAESPTEHLLRLAEPYLDPTLTGGETVLSVGKMIELAHQGCHGAINVMPFGCMPSTIVGGMMKKLAAALGRMPAICLTYDGQQDPALQTRLEAFLYQARACQGEHGQ